MSNIAVIGTGYVGLVTGVCFADLGHKVTCMDIDESKIQSMESGKLPIYEPGLEEVFNRVVGSESISFTGSLKEAVKQAEIIFLALPTPPGADGSADLSAVLSVANALGPILRDRRVVVVDKSTVPVGTAEKVQSILAKNDATQAVVVSNPEFLREGFALHDFMYPDRVVIGSSDEWALGVMSNLYSPVTDDNHPLIKMDERSAELTKYAANSFLAVKITFMNQIANLCERLGVNVDSVRHGIGTDERIGSRFLFPGIGYGGSCFPKDVQALLKTSEEYDYDFGLISQTIDINRLQKSILATKIASYFGGDVLGKNIAIWGLAFKPDTDDVRESAAFQTIRKLIEMGANVVAYDPEAMDNSRKVLGDTRGLVYADTAIEAITGADALAIITEWDEFKSTDIELIKNRLARPVIFDGRNIYDLEDMRQAGIHYESIGRPVVN